MFTPPHVFDQPAPAFDIHSIETPAFVVDLELLRKNLERLALVQREAGVKVLLALKGFSMFSTFDLVREYLSGCCASGLNEALLAYPEYREEAVEVHGYFRSPEHPQVHPTVIDVLGPEYAAKEFRGVHIDNSVLDDCEVDQKEQIFAEGEQEKRRLAAEADRP